MMADACLATAAQFVPCHGPPVQAGGVQQTQAVAEWHASMPAAARAWIRRAGDGARTQAVEAAGESRRFQHIQWAAQH
jgi:hypothetical protein